MNHLEININPDKKLAPRYTEDTPELKIEKVVITSQGMKSGSPLVDFQLEGKNGQKYFAVTTGKLLIGLAAALNGVTDKNLKEII